MARNEQKIEEMISKKIDPVYKALSVKIGEADSKIMPYVFESIVNLEQARILNEEPAPSEEIAKKFNLNLETVEKHIQYMFEIGLLFPGKSGWYLTRSWGALHDSVGAADSKYDNDNFFELAFAKHEETNQKQFKEMEDGTKSSVRQGMRVIPRWKSIKDIPDVLPHEDVRVILKQSDPIVQLNCACRKIDRGKKCENVIPLETCLSLGRAGQYNLNRGAGKKLSYEEAMQLLDRLDAHPLVHMSGNSNRMPILLCNCHHCCCGVFQRNVETKKRYDQISMAKSRFVSTIDLEKCDVCGNCMGEICPSGALQLKYYPEYSEERVSINPEACLGCGLCVIRCPTEALKMKLVRPPEHIPVPGGEL